MAVEAKPKLDARRLRADFPVFEQQMHGKPLAYLDSANSSQKPHQVLDGMREFYETSCANVHRAVYVLGERASAGYEAGKVVFELDAHHCESVGSGQAVAAASGLDDSGPHAESRSCQRPHAPSLWWARARCARESSS